MSFIILAIVAIFIALVLKKDTWLPKLPLYDKYKKARQEKYLKQQQAQQTKDNQELFKTALLQSINAGKLTTEKITALDEKKAKLGLTNRDIADIKLKIFDSAFFYLKSNGKFTKETKEHLKSIQKYLNIFDNEIKDSLDSLSHLILLHEIKSGILPTAAIDDLVMQKNEVAYWQEPAMLMEEKTIRRRYEPGTPSVNLHIMKGVNYRVKGTRGHTVNETGLVPVSNGLLILTNQRMIFRGDGKVFAVKLDKILNTQVFRDGLQFSENNKPKPRLIKFRQIGNHDIIDAILHHSLAHYSLVKA